jgi:hypothetical protein
VSQSGVVELLSTFSRVMRGRKTRWYLFGAQAVAIWGGPRMTADVDVTVEGDLEDPLLVASLISAGFEPRVENLAVFVRRTRVAPMAHSATRIPIDVVFAGPGLEEEFLGRAVRVRIGRSSFPVIAPEDLIVTKILAGRAKDIEDVRGILRERRDRLNLEAIRLTLRRLEEALSRSDLAPVLDAELRRIAETE